MRFRDLLIRNIASPYGLTAASTILFLFAWTFPPSLYFHYVAEPDIMFLDPASLLFFLLCVIGFVAGLMVIDCLYPVLAFSHKKLETHISPMWFLLTPIIFGTALTVLSIVLLLRNNINLIQLLLAAQGEQLKSDGGLDISGTLGLASVGLMGIVWWAAWRKPQLNLQGWRKRTVNLAIAIAMLTMLASATLRLGRGEFMPILAGIAITFLLHKLIAKTLTLKFMLKFAAIFVALVVVLFSAFSMMRGFLNPDDLLGNLIGYTIASYNRLAAILDGRLHYPFSGKGIYISSFVAFNDTFNNLFHVNSALAWPEFKTLWQSEFGAVSTAGLNGYLIWSGTFGYIFSDLRWLTPLLLFAYGMMTGGVWRSLKLGRITGIVLYPWFAFCILFWFGTNFLLDTKLVVLLIVALILACYEFVVVRTPMERPSHEA